MKLLVIEWIGYSRMLIVHNPCITFWCHPRQYLKSQFLMSPYLQPLWSCMSDRNSRQPSLFFPKPVTVCFIQDRQHVTYPIRHTIKIESHDALVKKVEPSLISLLPNNCLPLSPHHFQLYYFEFPLF